jgi:hypothetical protein
MVRKKTYLALFCILFLIPIQNTIAQGEPFNFQDKITDTTSIFFLVAMDENQTIQVNVTQPPTGNGEFYLFLFDFRPNTTNVNADKTLNPDVYVVAKEWDGPNNPSVEYNATELKIHYIQVVLLKNGPEFFTLECNLELERFYLPALPGYSLEFLVMSILLSLGLSIFIIRKKKMNKITL